MVATNLGVFGLGCDKVEGWDCFGKKSSWLSKNGVNPKLKKVERRTSTNEKGLATMLYFFPLLTES